MASRKSCVSHPQQGLGAGGSLATTHAIAGEEQKHRAKFSMDMGTSQALLGAPSIAPLWSAAGLGPCSVRGSPESSRCEGTLHSSGSLSGPASMCGSKGGRHTGANNVNTWCLQIMHRDALRWHFGLAWVLFSFSQVRGSFSQHILGAPKCPTEKLG